MLSRFGVSVLSATEQVAEDPVGKFTSNIIIAVAQFDNDAKSERTKVGMRAAAERGRWPFQAQLGYIMGKRGGPSLEVDPDRAPAVRQAFEMCATGAYSKREIVRLLGALGMRTRAGTPISAQTLGATLRNEIYVGRIHIPKWNLRTTGDFEPLVTEETFDRVQQVLSGRKRVTAYDRNNPDFPLRRFVSCNGCSRPLTGSWSTSRGRKYPYYHCPVCRGVRATKATLENQFIALLDGVKPERAYFRLFRAVVSDTWKSRHAATRRDRETLAARIARLRSRLERVDDAFLHEGSIDRRTYENRRDRLRPEIAVVESELPHIVADETDIESVLAFAEQTLTNAPQRWSASSVDQRQCLQKVLCPSGLPFDGGGFGTAVTCMAFSELRAYLEERSAMASPAGISKLDAPSRVGGPLRRVA
jgi:site-specific DNA recombinase